MTTGAVADTSPTLEHGTSGPSTSIRIGGGFAIAGGVLALAGNALAPRFNQDQDVDVYEAVARSGRLVPANLILITAVVLVAAGLWTVATTMRAGRGAELARLGAGAAVVGGSIAVVELSVETYAYRQLARSFLSADAADRRGAFWATASLDHLNAALFSTWTLVFLGLAPLLIAGAMARSRAFAAWIVITGLVGGALCSAVAVVDLVREDQTSLAPLFVVGSVLVTAWVIAAGTSLLRVARTTVST